ncbi:MAG: hypothetical protein WCT48_05265, partial [Candidatus Paceibacterota bacterium]
ALFAFPIAMAANETNLEPCGDSPWLCHGFETSYLHGTNSRTKIINDIIAALPIEPPIPPGKARVQGKVTFADTGEPAPSAFVYIHGASTTTDSAGFYTIYPQACTECDLMANANGIRSCAYEGGLTFEAGKMYEKNLVLSPDFCLVPE